MYIPAHFKVEEGAKLRAFIEQNSFATLVTGSADRPFATHLPVMIGNADDGPPTSLLAHVARANPQWRHFESRGEVLLIFHGPHAYISPFWYEAAEAVPTWNYAAVHVYGRATVFQDEARAREIVESLTRRYEGERAELLFNRWSQPFIAKMLKGIVAFEVQVTQIEGKFKLGQNRQAADIAGTFDALSRSKEPSDVALANLMKQHGVVGG